MRLKRWVCLLLALLMAVSLFAGCSSGRDDHDGLSGETKLSDLSGKKIGVMTGGLHAVLMPELIPDANYMEFNSVTDLIVTLNSKKVDAFGCGVNDLPLSMVLSWYEQKAVCILLTLLHLGIKNIRLGPTLTAFVSPNVLNFLVEKFNIAPITTPEEDLKAILG